MMADSLILEVHDLEKDVLTGIYSQETHLPQPLRISISADLKIEKNYAPGTPLSASKNYMDLKNAVTQLPSDVHFTLIEAVADHIITQLFAEDDRIARLRVKIIKLAIAEDDEAIGITMERARS